MIEVTTSKTGKHGHAKCHFTALDIFTNKKMEELVPSTLVMMHNLEVPVVSRGNTRCWTSMKTITCPSWTTRVTLAKI